MRLQEGAATGSALDNSHDTNAQQQVTTKRQDRADECATPTAHDCLTVPPLCRSSSSARGDGQATRLCQCAVLVVTQQRFGSIRIGSTISNAPRPLSPSSVLPVPLLVACVKGLVITAHRGIAAHLRFVLVDLLASF